MIRVENLSKRYGEIRAVDGVSFEAAPRGIYGLLGPNGAGKTTTISMICGLLAPDGGRVTIDGVDMAADPVLARSKIGVVPQDVALYEELSARENLRFWGGIYGLSGGELRAAVAASLEQVDLVNRADEPVSRFSGGMKRRLNLALGLVHSPRVVLLDEPTVGIDPQARASILDVVRRVAAAGATVLYTTHYLEEAETLCDRIGIMDHGRVLAEGTLDELKTMVGGEELLTVRGDFGTADASTWAGSLPGARLVTAAEDRLVLAAPGRGDGAAALLAAIYRGGVKVDAVSIQPPSLNSLFLKLTGRELRD